MNMRMICLSALAVLLSCNGSHDRVPEEQFHERDFKTEASREPAAGPVHASDQDAAAAKANGASDGAYTLTTSATEASGTAKPPSIGEAISSSAAVHSSDTSHRFVRTADLRFRVKDVVQATLGIEDIVGQHHGWVTSTRLRSVSKGEYLVPVSKDSTLEISRYELMNTITLRVPSTELDSTLRHVGRWVELFDHRTITADDIRLKSLANDLALHRAKEHSQRVSRAIDDQGRKLKETLSAEEALQASDERRDQNILDNLELADRVAFSTVTIDIHQRTLVRKELIANERDTEAYRPSLWSRIVRASVDGWHMLEALITALVTIWPLLFVGAIGLWFFLRNRNKGKQPPSMPSRPA